MSQHVVFGGGGGGAGGYFPNMLDGWTPPQIFQELIQPKKEDNDMKLTNVEAQDLARDILSGRRTKGLRERVEVAVEHLTELFTGVGDGSVFSFGRDIGGRTYHYAAIKSGGKWFSTGNSTALKDGDDDDLITWLVGLEIYAEDDLFAFAKTDVPALIEGMIVDET